MGSTLSPLPLPAAQEDQGAIEEPQLLDEAQAVLVPTTQVRVKVTSYLPQVFIATAFVAIAPVVAVWELRSWGVITSPWIGLFLAMALSTAASTIGCAYWKRRKGSGDLLFSELLIWE